MLGVDMTTGAGSSDPVYPESQVRPRIMGEWLPEIRTAQFAILDAIAGSITGEPEVAAMSERQYGRYARYGRQEVDGFREHFHEGVLMYLSLQGSRATGSGPGNPRIDTFSATTEAPDETARGTWWRGRGSRTRRR